ncbi:MAG: T9SS type A sorting domain-containing protein [Bacteroidales bacterium]|nr:T9SS type A sorting domain-containing protein [Bacteroidales bacterium]
MKNLFVLLLLLFLVEMISAQTTIQFSGITWNVRNGSGGPGPNLWSDSPNSVWVDADGQLHLKIRKVGSTYYCSEIYAQQSFGHGEYRFYVAGNVGNYDPEIVAGLFTYETDTREIDIEFSRWGNPANMDGWFTIQPVVAGNQQNFTMNQASDSSTHKFTWGSSNIFFQSYKGHYETLPATENLIKEWNYTGNYIPPVGNERLHINFWLFGGHSPVNQQEAELVITSVFVPSLTSIDEIPALKNMKIYPNPFLDVVTIELPENVNTGEISVLNSTGQEILRQQLTEKKTEIDLGKFPTGIYSVKLICNREVKVQKMIKQ